MRGTGGLYRRGRRVLGALAVALLVCHVAAGCRGGAQWHVLLVADTGGSVSTYTNEVRGGKDCYSDVRLVGTCPQELDSDPAGFTSVGGGAGAVGAPVDGQGMVSTGIRHQQTYPKAVRRSRRLLECTGLRYITKQTRPVLSFHCAGGKSVSGGTRDYTRLALMRG